MNDWYMDNMDDSQRQTQNTVYRMITWLNDILEDTKLDQNRSVFTKDCEPGRRITTKGHMEPFGGDGKSLYFDFSGGYRMQQTFIKVC